MTSDAVVVDNFINGEFCPSESYLDSYDPSTGNVWAKVAASTSKDIDKAVEAAQSAFPE